MTQSSNPTAERQRLARVDASGPGPASPGDKGIGDRVPIPAGVRAVGRYLGTLRKRYGPIARLESSARSVEDRLLNTLNARLQRARAPTPDARPSSQRTFFVPIHEPPGKVLDELLGMAARQSVEDAREYLYTALLRELVPDEACLLSILADGRPQPVAHILATGRFGGEEERVASYVSLLGEQEGIKLRGMRGYYFGHLVALGLIQQGADAKLSRSAQSALKATPAATAAERAIRERGLRPRWQFETVEISQLGRELWAYCEADVADTSGAASAAQ